jgi:hypothetical protein
VQVLQVGHHRHAAPRVPALRVGREGHGGLGRGVFLPHPAGRVCTQTSVRYWGRSHQLYASVNVAQL